MKYYLIRWYGASLGWEYCLIKTKNKKKAKMKIKKLSKEIGYKCEFCKTI